MTRPYLLPNDWRGDAIVWVLWWPLMFIILVVLGAYILTQTPEQR